MRESVLHVWRVSYGDVSRKRLCPEPTIKYACRTLIKGHHVMRAPRSDFAESVRDTVARIPRGKVSTYGRIARLIGLRSKSGLAVASAMGRPGVTKGWHRVVRADGTISPKLPTSDRQEQRRLLQDEDVEVSNWRISRFEQRLWQELEAARALSLDGCMSEHAYLCLTDRCNRLVEFSDGRIEELPLPTDSHQSVLLFLYRLFDQHVRPAGGVVLVAPLRLRIGEGRFREPDLLLLRDASDSRRRDRYWRGADLVAEVVSPDDPDRDYREKRADYAEARIPEYWIVDPRHHGISVLTLDGDEYVLHGRFQRGETATSATIEGFDVAVSQAFDL